LKLFRKNLLHKKNFYILIIFSYLLIFNYKNLVFSSQENYFDEMELNNNTKDGFESKGAIPTNPFELVDILRKSNSMNDATSPSDAIDEAIRSFDNLNLNDN